MADDDAGYTFVPSGDACDTCAAMAGVYPSPPAVPVHENCRCMVIGPDDSCENEIRNVQVSDDTYEAEWPMGEYSNCGGPAAEATISAGAAAGYSSHDEGMEGYLLEQGDTSQTVEVPANSTGFFTATVQVHSRWAVGELWKVCTSPDPVAGTHLKEVLIGDVGAASEVVESMEAFVESTRC